MVACAAITILCYKQVSHFLFPSCSARDKVLHAVFTVAIAVMVACAAITILCFKQVRSLPVSNVFTT